ncbi:hypothetical protein FRC03_001787 [Tulasnella sp. 419]|nr:hypothetical protein FRC03_001787 [Tulasnella sp. 419]
MEGTEDVGILVHEISTAMIHFTASRYLFAAGYVVMIYDHTLTFSEEVELVWMKPVNTISVFFLLIRYCGPVITGIDKYEKGGLASSLSKEFCTNWWWMEGLSQIVLHAMIHALVAFRVSALWGRNRVVDWLIGVAFTLMSSPPLDRMHAIEQTQLQHFENWTFWVWIPALLLETLLFALTVTRVVTHHRRVITQMPVAKILYRDGIVYFLVIALCTTLNVVAWTALPGTLVAIAKYFAMVNTMGCKLVLNLRGIKEKEGILMGDTGQTPRSIEVFQLSSSCGQHSKLPSSSVSSGNTATKRPLVEFYPRTNTSIWSAHNLEEGVHSTCLNTRRYRSVEAQVDVQADVDADYEGDSSLSLRTSDKSTIKDHIHW